MELDGVGHGVGSGCLRSARGSRAARMIRPYSTRRGPARTLAAAAGGRWSRFGNLPRRPFRRERREAARNRASRWF